MSTPFARPMRSRVATASLKWPACWAPASAVAACEAYEAPTWWAGSPKARGLPDRVDTGSFAHPSLQLVDLRDHGARGREHGDPAAAGDQRDAGVLGAGHRPQGALDDGLEGVIHVADGEQLAGGAVHDMHHIVDPAVRVAS
jgi:hypothetical protein